MKMHFHLSFLHQLNFTYRKIWNENKNPYASRRSFMIYFFCRCHKHAKHTFWMKVGKIGRCRNEVKRNGSRRREEMEKVIWLEAIITTIREWETRENLWENAYTRTTWKNQWKTKRRENWKIQNRIKWQYEIGNYV